jgi:hypothetical protein
MAFNAAIVCYAPGGVHLFLLPFAFFAMALYVAGLPVLSLWWLRKNKQVIKYDQLLRAQGVGSDRQTNPHFAFRKTWKALYMNYRPGAWGWEFVICVRKFLIAYCSLTFRATSSYQLAMALLVLFVAYILQVRTLPYLSHARAASTVAEHRAKVRDGSVIPITVRQLEAIVRLSESIARMYAIIFDMHSEIVTLCTCPARLTSRRNTCVRRFGCSG